MAPRRELISGHRVDEVIVDDAVVGRVETGDNGVVVGEGGGREDGDEALFGLGAAGDEAADVGGRRLELVTEAESIGGDEEHDGAGELGEGSSGRGAMIVRRREERGEEKGGGSEEEEEEKGETEKDGALGASGEQSGPAEEGRRGTAFLRTHLRWEF